MPALTLAAPVEIPAPIEPVRGLLRSARSNVDWPGGRVGSAIATQGRCATGVPNTVLDLCDPATIEPRERATAREWQPFIAWDADTCTTRGWQRAGTPDQAVGYLRADASRQVAREFWTGDLVVAEGYDNLYLTRSADMTVLGGGAVGTVTALGLLENALAGCAGQGMIHAPPRLATAWAADGLLDVAGADLRTRVMGTTVVVDAGYTGSAPDDVAAAAGVQWAYGTGLVYVLSGPIETDIADLADAVAPSSNEMMWAATQVHLPFWDGCCHVGVAATLAVRT